MIGSRERLAQINMMAVPLIINSITGLVIGLVDQAMVGRISATAFSSVGLITTTLYCITGIVGMPAVAFNIMGSKSVGKNDKGQFLNLFKISLFVSTIVGMIFYAVILLFKMQILQYIFGLNGELLSEAIRFLNIYAITLVLNLVIFCFSAYFKIINKTKWIFWGSLTAGLLNLVLDYILIFGKASFPKMGVVGAGIASATALAINLLIYIIVIPDKTVYILKIQNCFINIKEMLMLSLPLMGQEFLEGTLFIIVINAMVARMGVIELSIFTLLFSITNIILMPMYGYSSASLTLVSQNINNKKEVSAIPKVCLFMALIFYFGLVIISLIFRDYIPRIMTNDNNLIILAASYLPIALTVQLFNYPHSIYKYSLQGIREEKWVLAVSTLINIISIILVFILTFILQLRLTGVYFGIGINYLILAGMLLDKYKKSIDKP